jgi:cystathionine beta-synthase
MDYAENILSLVGNTPLVKLNRVTATVKPLVLAKLEFLNPGGSIKDRIGNSMLQEAIKEGRIQKGGTIVEPSSGNTGVGLALSAIILGLKLVVTMPDKMSVEKQRLLEAYGAKVVVCPTHVPPDDPRSYIEVAKRIASETPNSFMPNQYANQTNPEAHYRTTGPEIWKQTKGKITHFVAGIGTGGTITGVSKYLKEKNPRVKTLGVDPEGSIFQDVLRGVSKPATKVYKIEGIGEDFLPKTVDLTLVDDIVKVSDREAYSMARTLAREEALLVGSSSGAAVAGTLKVCADLNADAVVVTILPDRGDRYLTKLYNEEWMKESGFL